MKNSSPSKPISTEFAAFAVAFDFLSHILLFPPEAKFLHGLKKESLLQSWPISPDNPSSRSGIAELQASLSDEPHTAARILTEEFMRLFSGPGAVLAPPFESLYLGKDKILFDLATIQVREYYRRYDLKIRNAGKVPDDHMGYELAFTAEICRHLAGEKTDGPRGAAGDLLAFLESHTLRWSDAFTGCILENAETSYYKGTALLLRGTLTALVDLLRSSRA